MYWDPFEEIDRMHREMNRLFSRSLSRRPMIGTDKQDYAVSDARTPVCHLQETENNIVATFEIPGVQKSDIDLIVDDDHMQLKVERKEEHKEDKEGKEMYSSYSSSYYRTVPLPKMVNSDEAKASYKNGVLRVEAPKKKTGKGRRIDVN